MQKRKLKWANIVGIMVFACALVLNIQTNLDGEVTIFQTGIAQETGGSSGSGTGTGTGTGEETPCVKCTGTTPECQRVYIDNESHIYYGERSACD